MTRRRIIALAIVLAAVCLVLTRDPRYRLLTPDEVQSHKIISEFWRNPVESPVAVADRVRKSVRKKRYSFLPGPTYVLPAEGCPLCQDERHDVCPGSYVFFVREERSVSTPSVRCTCPHPSHAQDPK